MLVVTTVQASSLIFFKFLNLVLPLVEPTVKEEQDKAEKGSNREIKKEMSKETKVKEEPGHGGGRVLLEVRHGRRRTHLRFGSYLVGGTPLSSVLSSSNSARGLMRGLILFLTLADQTT